MYCQRKLSYKENEIKRIMFSIYFDLNFNLTSNGSMFIYIHIKLVKGPAIFYGNINREHYSQSGFLFGSK